MSSSARLWAALGLCLTVACIEETPLAPRPEMVTVHAVLNPAERVQHVVITRESGSGGQMPVRGAAVSLVKPDGATLPATEVTGTSDYEMYLMPGGRYDVATSQIEAGRRYRLRVVLPDGRVVEGETTTPSVAPVTVASERLIDRNVDTLRLSWPRVPGARAYEVRVFEKRDSLSYYSYGYLTYTDTSFTLAGTARSRGSDIFIGGFSYDLVVSAVDANYYGYYAFDSDQHTGTALPASLQGAEGVFGALVPIVRMSITVAGKDPRLP